LGFTDRHNGAVTEPNADKRPERDLGVIQGREVYPGDPDHPTEPGHGRSQSTDPPFAAPRSGSSNQPPPPDFGSAPSSDGAGRSPGSSVMSPQDARKAAAFQQWLKEVRSARKNVPNSRPLPTWVERLAWILDSVFEIPGTRGRRVGIDGMLTFVPVVGDVAGLGLSMIVVAAGIASGVSIPTVVRMMLNVGLETVIGLVPFAGALFDMAYKANERNVVLIEADLADRKATRRSSLGVLAVTVAVILAAVAMAVLSALLTLAISIWVIRWFVGLF